MDPTLGPAAYLQIGLFAGIVFAAICGFLWFVFRLWLRAVEQELSDPFVYKEKDHA